MAGLGKRGQEKVANGANELFTQTEKPENQKNGNPENNKADSSKPRLVKKSFVFSFELAEELRKYCFENRKKEVDVVREALDSHFRKNEKD